MAKNKYNDYKFDTVTGKWYGYDKYNVPHEVKRPPKSVQARRAYKTNSSFHAGYQFVADRYKHSFPKGVVKKSDRGKYRIGMRFSKEQTKYQPFAALNAKRSGVTVIDGRHFAKHIFNVIEKLSINSQNFTIILSLRAKKIFQDSFKYKRFYSAGGDKWENLDPKTIKKRRRRGTWPGAGGMLAEYGNMYDSITSDPINDNKGVTVGMRVHTDSSYYRRTFNTGKTARRKFYKHSIPIKRVGSFCYAGLHNEGGRIRGGHKLPKRQFMGHSSYLFDFAEQEMNKYLFYNVFD